MLPKEVCVFGRIFEVGAEQSVWESVGVGEILGGAIEAKDIENDAGVSCCHRYGVGGNVALRNGQGEFARFLPSSLCLNISWGFPHLALV